MATRGKRLAFALFIAATCGLRAGAAENTQDETYTHFLRWDLSFDYPRSWQEHPADRVAMIKQVLAAQLGPYDRQLNEFTYIAGPKEETALLVMIYTIPKPMKSSEFVTERNQVYEEARKAGDVTKVNYVRETTISGLPCVEEDVERSSGARGKTHKVIDGLRVFEISFIADTAQQFSKCSEFLDHLASTIGVGVQEVVRDKAYQVAVVSGWTRAPGVPQGFDLGFRNQLAGEEYATFYFHHEVMPLGAGALPDDASDVKRQWDSMLRNRYPDMVLLSADVPAVQGTILVNGLYEMTDEGAKVRRQYTYFLSGNTAFIVQCSSPPLRWAALQRDFAVMRASLRPGSSTPATERKSDEAVRSELKSKLPTLVASFPASWACSVSEVGINPAASAATRTLEIHLRFDRSDLGSIYDAVRLVFGMMKAGKADADLSNLSAEVQAAAIEGADFMKYVGQVVGCAYLYVAACDPPIERYSVSVSDPNGNRVGSVSISQEDLSGILAMKAMPADLQKFAAIYVFESPK